MIETDTTQLYKDKYSSWQDKSRNGGKQRKFAKVPNEIMNYLGTLKPGAIRLYLYYCLRAKNETGECWPTLETISKDLNVSTRTIEKDNKELIENGLIVRINTRSKNKTTVLLPLGEHVRVFDNFNEMKSFLYVNDRATVYGEIDTLYQVVLNKQDGDTITQEHTIIASLNLTLPNGTNKNTIFMSNATLDNHSFSVLPETLNDDLCTFTPSEELLKSLGLTIEVQSLLGVLLNPASEFSTDYELATQMIGGADFDSYPTTTMTT